MRCFRFAWYAFLLSILCLYLCACKTNEQQVNTTAQATLPAETNPWELYMNETVPKADVDCISYSAVDESYDSMRIHDMPRFAEFKELPAFNTGMPLTSEKEQREYANVILENLDAAGYKYRNPTDILYYEIEGIAVYIFEDLVQKYNTIDRPAENEPVLDGGTMYFAVDCKTGKILHIGYGLE